MEKARSLLKTPLGWLILTISTWFCLAPVWAETQNTLTLDQAVAMALKNNYQVRISHNDLEKAKLTVKQEVARIYPQASVDGQYGYDLDQNNFPTNYTITISETYPTKLNLYGQQIPTSVEASLWDQVSSEMGLQITEANVVYNTTAQYLTALKAKKLAGFQELAVKNAQTAANIAQEQLARGKITKPAQLKTESDLATAEYTLEKNRSDYLLALCQLGNLIGLEDLSQVELMEVANTLVVPPNYSQLRDTVLQNRLEIRQAQITVDKAQRVLAQASNQELPDLSLGYSNINQTMNFTTGYSFLSGNLSGNALHKSVADNRDTRFGPPDRTLFLKLTWNLDFGITRGQTQISQAGVDTAKNNQKLQEQNIRLELDQAIAAYQLAVKKAATDRQAIPFFQKTLEIKHLQYQLGSATQLEVSTAEQDLLQAQITATGSGYDETAACQKLKLVSGSLYQWHSKQNEQGAIQ
jgi:outer membrane protein